MSHVSYTFNRETLDRHIDRRRRALTQLQKQLSTLTSNVHDLKSKKVTNWGVLYSIKKKKQDWVVTYVVIIIIPQLKLSEQLQRRTHLEEQKAELTSKNDAFAREIRVNTKTSWIYYWLIEFPLIYSYKNLFPVSGCRDPVSTHSGKID